MMKELLMRRLKQIFHEFDKSKDEGRWERCVKALQLECLDREGQPKPTSRFSALKTSVHKLVSVKTNGGRYQKQKIKKSGTSLGDYKEFVRVVRKEYAALASEKHWNIYGLDASIAAVIERLNAALAMYQEAVDEEDAEVQSILKGDTFCINWVSGKGKAHCIAVAQMIQTIRGWIESYDELDMNDFSAVSAWVAKVYKAGGNKAIFETKSEGFASFKMLLRGCSGPSFMPRMLPGCLHLFLRTVERVVAAEGVYKHVISNSKDAAIDAARAAGVEVEFGYDTYQTEALVCRLVGGACGDWAANLSRHFDEVAKLYGEHDKHELELLVRAAYLLPYMLYKAGEVA